MQHEIKKGKFKINNSGKVFAIFTIAFWKLWINRIIALFTAT